MTIENFEKGKKLREEIGRLNSIKNNLSKNDAVLNISNGFMVPVKLGSQIHVEMICMFDTMVKNLENEFKGLGDMGC